MRGLFWPYLLRAIDKRQYLFKISDALKRIQHGPPASVQQHPCQTGSASPRRIFVRAVPNMQRLFGLEAVKPQGSLEYLRRGFGESNLARYDDGFKLRDYAQTVQDREEAGIEIRDHQENKPSLPQSR